MGFSVCAPSSHSIGPSWGPAVLLTGGILTAGGTESGDDPSFGTLHDINIPGLCVLNSSHWGN